MKRLFVFVLFLIISSTVFSQTSVPVGTFSLISFSSKSDAGTPENDTEKKDWQYYIF